MPSNAITEARAAAPLSSLRERYRAVRARSRQLAEPLAPEDYVVQSMPDVSPTKWHLAHTAWFFETFVLARRGLADVHPAYKVLFNSYYNAVGEQFPRSRRGMLTRPTVDEMWAYRHTIDMRMLELIDSETLTSAERSVVELGLQHEQQHQELMLTDIKHVLFQNPLLPAYASTSPASTSLPSEHRFVFFAGGQVAIGHHGAAFGFDNEGPRHELLAPSFELGSRLVTTAEYAEFVADGGYRRPELWLSEGWAWVNEHGVDGPLYGLDDDRIFTLHGARPRDPHEPVTHVSLYEADAYATWSDARLPREHELELALAAQPVEGNFADSGMLHAVAAVSAVGADAAVSGLEPRSAGVPRQLFGDAWEWTQSAYSAYPGYRPPEGAIGEYNGKFMCNQHVLRGGSCFTPRSHMRASYRNFFPASTRWQMTGIRLAKDASAS